MKKLLINDTPFAAGHNVLERLEFLTKTIRRDCEQMRLGLLVYILNILYDVHILPDLSFAVR